MLDDELLLKSLIGEMRDIGRSDKPHAEIRTTEVERRRESAGGLARQAASCPLQVHLSSRRFLEPGRRAELHRSLGVFTYLVFGALNMDLKASVNPEQQDSGAALAFTSPKAANEAVAIARLGMSVLVGRVGDDALGDTLKKLLQKLQNQGDRLRWTLCSESERSNGRCHYRSFRPHTPTLRSSAAPAVRWNPTARMRMVKRSHLGLPCAGLDRAAARGATDATGELATTAVRSGKTLCRRASPLASS